MSKINLYRITFHNQGKIYEVYAKSVHQGALFGFIEIEKLVFGEKTSLVVDPAEENLKSEFQDVIRTYIPMHSIVRIDEVSKRGTSKISDAPDASNIAPFPVYTRSDS
ncbi:MAG: DUF1820 family protein [Gammaproteobacteria bacterium]